jgi:hypothetical protein
VVKWLVCLLAVLLALSITACSESKTPSDADNRAAKDLVRTYEKAIASGDAAKAESLFLPTDPSEVRELVAKNIAYARTTPAAAVPQAVRFYWLADGELAPGGNDGALHPSELSKLDELTREYPMAAFVTFEAASADLTRFFVVRTDDGFKLVRPTQ